MIRLIFSKTNSTHPENHRTSSDPLTKQQDTLPHPIWNGWATGYEMLYYFGALSKHLIRPFKPPISSQLPKKQWLFELIRELYINKNIMNSFTLIKWLQSHIFYNFHSYIKRGTEVKKQILAGGCCHAFLDCTTRFGGILSDMYYTHCSFLLSNN